MTDEDVKGGEDVDGPITPATGRVQLLVEVWQPDSEHPAVAADEPRQQKPAQQKLGKPAHVNLFVDVRQWLHL